MGTKQARLQENLKPVEPLKSTDNGVHLVWLRLHTQLFHPLSTNILREIYAFILSFDSLVWITTIQLRNFNFRTGELDPAIRLERTIRCDFYSRWSVFDSSRWVVCGGGGDSGWQTAYLVHSTGSVQQLPNMIRGRRACGLTVWRGAVCVFGSIGSAACERLAVSALTWEELPDMHAARWNFNATLWENAVFLCQGSVDVFDGRNMQDIGLKLPEGGNTLSFACRKSLLILSTLNYVVLEMRENRAFIVGRETHQQVLVASHPTPVLFQGQLVGLENGQVCRYSLRSGERLE